MNMYKKLKKGRKKQIDHIYKKMDADKYYTDKDYHTLSFDNLFMSIDSNWKNLFPIEDTIDAVKVCKKIITKILVIDNTNIAKIRDVITIYVNLYYLEGFINNSLIQNNTINNSYAYIKNFLLKYESGMNYITIKY